jgi:hypothetical protein
MQDFERQFEQIAAHLKIDDRPNAAHKETLRRQMLEVSGQSSAKPSRPIRPVRSKIMKSNITKTAAAAVILLAAFIGTNLLNGTPAWADVLEQVQKAKSVSYKCASQVEDFCWTTEVMINSDGVQRHVLNNGANVQIFDFRNGVTLQLDPARKAVFRTERTPEPFMKLFNSLDFLASRHEKGSIRFAGYETIEGTQAEVYQDIQPLQHSCTTIWINRETKLPVRVITEDIPPTDGNYFPVKDICIKSRDFGCDDFRSMSVTLSGSCTPQYRKQVLTDFKWNIDLEPALFSTEIPVDYEAHEQTLTKPGESHLIETLQFWAEMTEGPLPVDVNEFMDPATVKPMIVEKFKKGLNPKQEFEDACDFMTTVRWAASFVEKKIVMEKDWHVSSEPVFFGEGDKPLYWWRLEDSGMYRVIYGDLRVEDTMPEDLPQ